jgi:hypothetical protein
MDTYHLNKIAQCDLLLLHDAHSMLDWTSHIGVAGSVCMIPQAHRGRKWLHDRLNRAMSALCSHYILSVSIFHSLIMTMFISHKSPCPETAGGLWAVGTEKSPQLFPEACRRQSLGHTWTPPMWALSWDLEHRYPKYHFLDEWRKIGYIKKIIIE